LFSKAWFRCALVALAITTCAAVPHDADAFLGDCVQPLTTGPDPAVGDCLFILRVAAGLQDCQPTPCICNPAGIGPISAVDALICLSLVVRLDPPLDCPCTVDCEDSEAPTCGGSCETAPGTSCVSIDVSDADGGNAISICECIPPGVELCSDATAPDCRGACAPGSVCQNAGDGACECSTLPLQGTCAQASTPSCGGTCPNGFICEDIDGSCDCVEFTGQPETCFDAEFPVCGGACALGELCAAGIVGQCECFLSCEVSSVPSCGGTCNPGHECGHRVATIGNLSLDFCACLPTD
jgi:hypothetical protein